MSALKRVASEAAGMPRGKVKALARSRTGINLRTGLRKPTPFVIVTDPNAGPLRETFESRQQFRRAVIEWNKGQ